MDIIGLQKEELMRQMQLHYAKIVTQVSILFMVKVITPKINLKNGLVNQLKFWISLTGNCQLVEMLFVTKH
jgi:hypothetical protein